MVGLNVSRNKVTNKAQGSQNIFIRLWKFWTDNLKFVISYC